MLQSFPVRYDGEEPSINVCCAVMSVSRNCPYYLMVSVICQFDEIVLFADLRQLIMNWLNIMELSLQDREHFRPFTIDLCIVRSGSHITGCDILVEVIMVGCSMPCAAKLWRCAPARICKQSVIFYGYFILKLDPKAAVVLFLRISKRLESK